MFRRRWTQAFSEAVSPTSTTKLSRTIGWSTLQRASRMFTPDSASARERSSRSRGRSQASIWISARNDVAQSLAHETVVKRSRVGRVLVVDSDVVAERDLADDLVSGHRPAALSEPQHHVAEPLQVD